jgi:folylpolyglutamate synthase/dihydropteroate synthase
MGQKYGLSGMMMADVNQAIAYIKNKMRKDDLGLVTGSTYLIAEIDEII